MTESSHEKLPPFLRKTWDIVEDHTTDHIVRWSASGRSFVVLNVESFAKEILPRFFKHSNWSSFVRQLNTYGFRKIDPDRWEFANENFSKGGKDQLNVIQRRKPTLTSTMTALVGQTRAPEVGAGMQHAQPSSQAQAQPQHHQPSAPAPDYMLAQPYPLDLRHTPVPLFHASTGATTPMSAPQPQNNHATAGVYGISAVRAAPEPRHAVNSAPMPMQGIVLGPDAVQQMPAYRQFDQQQGFQQQQSFQQQQKLQPQQGFQQQHSYQQQQQAPLQQQQHNHNHAHHQSHHQQQHPHAHHHARAIANTQARDSVMQMRDSRDSNTPTTIPSSLPGGGGPVDRVSAMMEEYMKPGQRILANMQQPLDMRVTADPRSHQVVQDSRSTSTTSNGPSVSGGPSTECDGDTEETRKISKRGRADLHGKAMGGAGSSSSGGGPDTATWYPQCYGTALPFGPMGHSFAVESTLLASHCLDKDGVPLPPGITRPKPQAAGIAAQSLISEMAGQIGRLSHLAAEVRPSDRPQEGAKPVLSASSAKSDSPPVQDLKEDNAKLRQGMDMMLHRGQGQPVAQDVAPIHAMLAEQHDTMWQYKVKSDEMSSGMQMQIAVQQHAQMQQQERSSVLEAQVAVQRKMAFDTAEAARTLEMQNVDLTRKLLAQENINMQQYSSNQALEARVAELEQQLSGRQERMLKGLEDRMLLAMNEMMSASAKKATEAAGRGGGGSMAAAAALAEDMKASLTTGKQSLQRN